MRHESRSEGRRMVLTVTPSPSIDRTVEVENFQFEVVNRAVRSGQEPSGKGVNVSCALHRQGIETRAVFPAGGSSGSYLVEALAEQGVEHVAVESGIEVRTNITLVTAGRAGTKINEVGGRFTDELTRRLLDAVTTATTDATTVAVCGSLPPGVPTTFHRDVVGIAKAVGADAVVDASGTALARSLEAAPDLIKPNVHELAELTGRSILTFGDVVDAAEAARAAGARAVLASLGGDGAMLVDEHGALHGYASGIRPINAVGAGDALLAGFLSGGATREVRLANALLFASSAVVHSTTLFHVRPDLAAQIHVATFDDPARRLGEASAPLAQLHPENRSSALTMHPAHSKETK